MNTLPSMKETKQGWFSSPKNTATTVVGIGALAAFSYVFLTYVLPWLVVVTWNAISLSIGGAILLFLFFVFSNKKFWRALKYLAEFIASYTLGAVIELNPFKIIEAQIQQGEEDRQDLLKQGTKVAGKKEDLLKQIFEQNEALRDNKIKAEELMKTAQRTNEDYDEEISLYSNNVQRAVDFINQVQPIADDLTFIEEFCKKAYKSTGLKLQDARNELKTKKAAYEAVTSGLSVAKAAWKALNGDDDKNQDAEKAMEILRNKVSNSLAEMKNTMQLTNQVMKDIDLSNRVRARKGIETIKQLNSENSTSYIGSSLNIQGNNSLHGVKTEFDNSQNRFKNLLD